MSVNIFGSRSKNKPTIDSSINSKFITLTNQLQTKVDKTGDTLSGNLCMGDNKITCLADPISDNDVTNKMFVESKVRQESTATKLYIDTLLSTKLDRNINENLDMNEFSITNVKNPTGSFDAVNKIYLQISTQKDDISMDNLLKVADCISDLFNKYRNNEDLNSYRAEFSASHYNAATSRLKYGELFSDVSFLMYSCGIFIDLKINIIKIITILPEDIFSDLKSDLLAARLVATPEEGTLRKKFRRFINHLSSNINPIRTDKQLELLVQKNFLLIDMGFTYLADDLLHRLLGSRS